MDRQRRAFPAGNTLVAQRFDHVNALVHARKVSTARSTIDDTAPRGFHTFTSANSRKARLQRERQQQIVHENTRLLREMRSIAKSSSKASRQYRGSNEYRASLQPIPGVRLDASSRPVSDTRAHAPSVRSSNERARALEQRRIDRENERLQSRLQSAVPDVQSHRLEEEYQQHKQLLCLTRGLPAHSTSPNPSAPASTVKAATSHFASFCLNERPPTAPVLRTARRPPLDHKRPRSHSKQNRSPSWDGDMQASRSRPQSSASMHIDPRSSPHDGTDVDASSNTCSRPHSAASFAMQPTELESSH